MSSFLPMSDPDRQAVLQKEVARRLINHDKYFQALLEIQAELPPISRLPMTQKIREIVDNALEN